MRVLFFLVFLIHMHMTVILAPSSAVAAGESRQSVVLDSKNKTEKGPLGHNLTATSHLIPKGQCAIGFQATGCGLSPSLAVAFSPWLAADYRMTNFFIRLKWASVQNLTFGHQLAYFKSTRQPPLYSTRDAYNMEAVWNSFLLTQVIAPDLKVHWNQHVNYYLEESHPFSLRRPSINRTPWQFNTSMLIEADLIQGFFMLGELGLLDWTRPPNHFHFGASMGRKSRNWEWHGGFSISATLASWFTQGTRTDLQGQNLPYELGQNQAYSEQEMDQDFSLHPEFSVQYYF